MNLFNSRRWDGAPETAADARFFALRESGYTGPIDQHGNAVTTGTNAEVHRHLADRRGETPTW